MSMNKKQKEILEGLKTAMEAELTGHQFYKAAAKSTKDLKGREAFMKMAEEEMGHFNELRKQYKSVLGTGEYDFIKKLSRGRAKRSSGPIFSKDIKKRIRNSHFEVSALNIGMKLELDAMNFYRNCAKKATNPDAKAFYNDLAEWEQGHYHAFKNQLDMLKEEYFTANHFVPF
jgi:rubrerythrin